MNHALRYVVLAVVVALAAFRLSRRVRRGGNRGGGGAGLGAMVAGDTALVALREVRERVRGRTFRVVTILMLAVVGVSIVLPTLHRGQTAQQVGIVDDPVGAVAATVTAAARSISTTVHTVNEPSPAAARAALRSGRLDLAVVGGDYVVVDKSLSLTETSTTAELARAVAAALGVSAAFRAAGLSPAQAAVLSKAHSVPVRAVQASAVRGAARNTSIVGLVLVFILLTQYLTWTLMGVMEEKASRVVEVLLAAVRPLQLLGGKVLGIGIVALGQAALLVAFAVVLAKAVGSDLLKGTTPLVLVVTLVWFLLGYAFYCWVYAAGGSMAERQGQIQSLALPLNVPIIFGYIVSITAASSGSASTLFKVLGFIPPMSSFAVPVLFGLSAITWWQLILSAGISVVATGAMAVLAAAVYRRAVLRTGRRVRLSEVLPILARRPMRA
ncbi:MAG TPA: ABC transporter permease [Acidimicrobiales bacterium]|nr:ABC transporter permease [Acidimicrobiales bacterium]